MHVTKMIVFFLRQTKYADYYHRSEDKGKHNTHLSTTVNEFIL